jgi:hypothetical protein
MKARLISILIPTLWLAAPLAAQEQEVPVLGEYSAEQRWGRASSQFTLSWVAAIAYAKSVGQSVKEYGEFCVETFAPSWGEPGSGSVNIIRGMQRNFLLWTGAEFELVDASATSATGRLNTPWSTYFGDDRTWYGITQDEFESLFRIFNEGVADHLGLDYSDRVEGEWWYMTFTERD